MSLISGRRAIELYLEAQQSKGLVYEVTYVQQDLLTYETHWNTHQKILTPEIQRLAEEHKSYVEMRAGVLAAGEGIPATTVFRPADYVFVSLDLAGMRPARIIGLEALQRKAEAQ